MKGPSDMTHLPNVQDFESLHGIPWHELTQREPELTWLLWQARQAGASCRSWGDVYATFSPIRHRLAALLGVLGKHRRDPILGSPGAYEVAYWKLYEGVVGLLPRPGGGQALPAA
jgi:hypothetical protein